MTHPIAPGARIVGRDTEWLVRKVNRTSTGALAIHCVGISEIVRDAETVFLNDIDRGIEVLDPAETKLVPDSSNEYRASRLFIESQLRRVPPTDEALYVGHKGAMDLVDFQLDPAAQALRQPRQRILIADAVGLGKTLEAGILASELIRRGRGKRILVATVKSVLTQFQKEWWTRFTIPLTRLDSAGIERVQTRIPANHNPFHYYDKTIISIDTLKLNPSYRDFIKNAYWDIIVIDEAHNVAERGSNSLRARLAQLLATRSDTLILLSATPHDGRAESFASLMNMLDPTAIANPKSYGKEDIKGLFIRRFKKDIKDQVAGSFKEREIAVVDAPANPVEEAAFDTLAALNLSGTATAGGRAGRPGAELFRQTLEKALFSSPAACTKTIEQRLKKLPETDEMAEERADLDGLAGVLRQIGPQQFGKYQKLVRLIRDPGDSFGWTGGDTADRLVIFTERIETLRFLKEHLPKELGLPAQAVADLYGEMSDVEQQAIVEEFGRDTSKLRLLICSDVASEGINLHFLCHRMIHFDIPWSLMVFQQRNGRIDRYGQERTPQIRYLRTQTANERIRGDLRILEILIRKDEQAARNIGDPSAFMGSYDAAEQERITARAMADGLSADDFAATLDANLARSTNLELDPLAMLLATATADQTTDTEPAEQRDLPTLFDSDYAYVKAALDQFRQAGETFQVRFRDDEAEIELTAPPDLRERLRFLPAEISPDRGPLRLSADRKAVMAEMARCRVEERSWPALQYLWPLHPAVDWVNDKVLAAFRRHEAPVMVVGDALRSGETVFLMSGLIPNRRGHPLVHRWIGVCFRNGRLDHTETFDDLLARTGLARRRLSNPGHAVDAAALRPLLQLAVAEAKSWMGARRAEFRAAVEPRLKERTDRLENLQGRHVEQLTLDLAGDRRAEHLKQDRAATERKRIEDIFKDHRTWIEESMKTEDAPFIQVIAVLMERV